MKRRRTPLQVSTFPFLAVLLCTMGALILLLLVMDRRAKLAARTKIQEALHAQAEARAKERARRQAELLAEQARLAAERQAEWERRRKALRARLEKELQQIRAKAKHIRDKEKQATSDVKTLEAGKQQLQQQIDKEIAAIAEYEKKLKADRAKLKDQKDKSSKTQQELEKIARELQQLEETLADLKLAREQDKHTYSLVPYDGKHGGKRKPLYVECAAHSIVLHPEKEVLVAGRDIRFGIERKLQEIQAQGANAMPYVLLLVRPSGIRSFYMTKNALRGLPVEFGYELIEDDWVLDFTENDDKREAMPWSAGNRLGNRRGINDARPGGTGHGGSSAGPHPGKHGQGHGSGGKPGVGPVGMGSKPGPHGTGPGTGVGSGTKLYSGQPGASPGTGVGMGTRPYPGQPGTGHGPGGKPGASPGIGVGMGKRPYPGQPGTGHGPGGKPGARPGTGVGMGTRPYPGQPGAGRGPGGKPGAGSGASVHAGTQPGQAGTGTKPGQHGPGQGHGKPGQGQHHSGMQSGSTKQPGSPGHGTNTSPLNGQETGQPGNARGQAAGRWPAIAYNPSPGQTGPGSQGIPGPVNSQSSNGNQSPQATQGNRSQGANKPGQGQSQNRASQVRPGENRPAPPRDPNQVGPPDPNARSEPNPLAHPGSSGGGYGQVGGIAGGGRSRPSRRRRPLLPNRDWTIRIECTGDSVVLPSGVPLPIAEWPAYPDQNHPLLQEVREIIDRRKANRTDEEFHPPEIRFMVRPNGLRTYYMAFPALEPLGLRLTRENLDPEY